MQFVGLSTEELKRRLFVDHCHKTNKIRGLLCINCNNGLGAFKDNVFSLNRAIQYLKENNGDNNAKV